MACDSLVDIHEMLWGIHTMRGAPREAGPTCQTKVQLAAGCPHCIGSTSLAMELKQMVMLALQVSILCTVFGFGLQATGEDLLYLVRRPGLLARSLLSVFVIMPAVAVALVRVFTFPTTVGIVVLALAISPVPPLLPKKEASAGGDASFALGLMAMLSLVAIAAVPLSLEVLGRIFGREVTVAPGVIAGVMLKVALVPLLAGMVVRAAWPATAARLEKPVSLVVKIVLPVAVLLLLVSALPMLWALAGSATLLALVTFSVAGLAIGHVLGGPNSDHSVVLALSTACRHPAIALTVATTNFPSQKFGGIILLYLIVNAIVGIPYVAWQRRQMPGAVRTA
jgi:BASS family bile acid:Na+ symporter